MQLPNAALWNEVLPAGCTVNSRPNQPRVVGARASAPEAPAAAAAPRAAGGKGGKGGAAAAPAIVPWVSTGAATGSGLSCSLEAAAEGAGGALAAWRTTRGLRLLSLAYDLTPASMVDVLITEVGPIEPTAGVPRVLLEFACLEEASIKEPQAGEGREAAEEEEEEGGEEE